VNLDLKVAIVRARRTQRALSIDARMSEVRLCDIIAGRAKASEDEEVRLASLLGVARESIFQVAEHV
jgi:hypothetical protein